MHHMVLRQRICLLSLCSCNCSSSPAEPTLVVLARALHSPMPPLACLGMQVLVRMICSACCMHELSVTLLPC